MNKKTEANPFSYPIKSFGLIMKHVTSQDAKINNFESISQHCYVASTYVVYISTKQVSCTANINQPI